jgi:hypothetical protein
MLLLICGVECLILCPIDEMKPLNVFNPGELLDLCSSKSSGGTVCLSEHGYVELLRNKCNCPGDHPGEPEPGKAVNDG